MKKTKRLRSLAPLVVCGVGLLFGTPAAARSASGASLGDFIGTVILEKGGSCAYFSEGPNFWRVGEGDKLSDGSVLVEVRSDRLVLDQNGERMELPLFVFSSSGGSHGPAAESAPRRVALVTAPSSANVPSPTPTVEVPRFDPAKGRRLTPGEARKEREKKRGSAGEGE